MSVAEEPPFQGVPHSREAEEGVIGSVLINPGLFPGLADRLKAEDFYLVRNRLIWESFARLAGAGLSIDLLTVTVELGTAGRLEDIGGQAYLFGLIANTPTSLNAESYARFVRETAGKRTILRLSGQLAGYTYDDHSVDQIVEYARRGFDRIVGAEPGNPPVEAAVLAGELYDALGEAGPGETPLSTGLADLDKKLSGGLRRGRLYLLAGRPGSGKSALLLGVAAQAAAQGRRVALFSLEMPNEEQGERLLSQLSGVPHEHILRRRLLDDDWMPLTQAVARMGDLPMVFDDTPSPSIADLRAKCRRIAEDGLDLLVVDSLNLLDARMEAAKPHERINWLAYQLKIMARELGVPVLAAHHMSRRFELGGEREPELADLEQAGEKPADVVAFLYGASGEAQALPRKLKIAKQRSGATGLVDLVFLAPTLRFACAEVKREEGSSQGQ